VSSGSTQSSSKAPIIGGVVGGLAGLALLAALLYFCCRRRGSRFKLTVKRKKEEQNKEVDSSVEDPEEAKGQNSQQVPRDPFAEFGGSSKEHLSSTVAGPSPPQLT